MAGGFSWSLFRRPGEVLRGHMKTTSPLPASPFEACAQASGEVNSQGQVCHDTNDSSVPVAHGIEEHDFVVPCYTALTAENSLHFVVGTHANDFRESYLANMAIREEVVAGRQTMRQMPNQGYVIVSIIPGYNFTSMTLPYSRVHASVPTISIGKFYDQGGTTLIPAAITSNHALVDGHHVGQFLDCLTTAFSGPKTHMSLSG